jgi:hypothetical protein
MEMDASRGVRRVALRGTIEMDATRGVRRAAVAGTMKMGRNLRYQKGFCRKQPWKWMDPEV